MKKCVSLKKTGACFLGGTCKYQHTLTAREHMELKKRPGAKRTELYDSEGNVAFQLRTPRKDAVIKLRWQVKLQSNREDDGRAYITEKKANSRIMQKRTRYSGSLRHSVQKKQP